MMSQTSKREPLSVMQPRYTLGDRTTKQHVLDEFVAATGYHRKYAIQLLNHPAQPKAAHRRPQRCQLALWQLACPPIPGGTQVPPAPP